MVVVTAVEMVMTLKMVVVVVITTMMTMLN